jgi:hypothetical protein
MIDVCAIIDALIADIIEIDDVCMKLLCIMSKSSMYVICWCYWGFWCIHCCIIVCMSVVVADYLKITIYFCMIVLSH